MRILHLFNWRLKDIIPILEDVSNQKFDGIQINPIQPLKEEDSNAWWMSYQPIDFRIGNKYGSEDELRYLCMVAKNYNIKIIADIICNHMAGKTDGSLYPHEKVEDYLKNNPYFWKKPTNVSNWNNRYEVTNYCIGLPGLNLCNLELQNIILSFIESLISCGISGIRFDAAKNIALFSEGCDFWTRIFYELTNYNLIKYGEIIFENPDVIYEYCNYIDVLTENCSLNSEKIFNFIESHDSYLDFGYTKSLSGNEINERYRDLSTISENTLYYARPFDESWKSEVVREANNNKVYQYKKYH